MLQWKGGVRRKVREKKDSLQSRQRHFFEQQRQKKELVASRLNLKTDDQISDKPSKSLDIVNLTSLLPPIKEHSGLKESTLSGTVQNGSDFLPYSKIDSPQSDTRGGRSSTVLRCNSEVAPVETTSSSDTQSIGFKSPRAKFGLSANVSYPATPVKEHVLQDVHGGTGQRTAARAPLCRNVNSTSEPASTPPPRAGIGSGQTNRTTKQDATFPGRLVNNKMDSLETTSSLHREDKKGRQGLSSDGPRVEMGRSLNQPSASLKSLCKGAASESSTSTAPLHDRNCLENFSGRLPTDELNIINIIDDVAADHQQEPRSLEAYASFAVRGTGGVEGNSPSQKKQSHCFEDIIYCTPRRKQSPSFGNERLHCTSPLQAKFIAAMDDTYSTPPAKKSFLDLQQNICATRSHVFSAALIEDIYCTPPPPPEPSEFFVEPTNTFSFGESSAGVNTFSRGQSLRKDDQEDIESIHWNGLDSIPDVWQGDRPKSVSWNCAALPTRIESITKGAQTSQKRALGHAAEAETGSNRVNHDVSGVKKYCVKEVFSKASKLTCHAPEEETKAGKSSLRMKPHGSRPSPENIRKSAIAEQQVPEAWKVTQEQRQNEFQSLRVYCETLESYVIELKLINRAVTFGAPCS